QSVTIGTFPGAGSAQSVTLCRAQLVPGARRSGRRARLWRLALGAGPAAALGAGTDGAGRPSLSCLGPPGRYDAGAARPPLSRARAGLPADGLAHETGSARRAASSRDVDRPRGRQGGLDRLSRSDGAGAEDLDRSKAGRTASGSGSASADDSVALGCAE